MELRQKFLEGMSRSASTVSVITTDGPAGRHGVTVSAMSSVSADSASPSLLVCINKTSSAADAIRKNGAFCVNVLRDDQVRLSDVFAGRHRDEYPDKFDFGEWTRLKTGAPVVPDALVAFDCQLKEAILHGSHWIFIGEADAIEFAAGMSPLIYANRGYAKPSPLVTRKAADTTERSVTVGCSTNWGPFFMGGIAARFGGTHPDVNLNVVEGTQRDLLIALELGDIDCAITHDLELPATLQTQEFTKLEPYCLLPGGDIFEDKEAVDLIELSRRPMILLDSSPVTEMLAGRFSDIGLTPNIAFRARTFEMVRTLVGNGLGYSILFTRPNGAAGYDGTTTTKKRLKEGSLPAMSLVLATRKSEVTTPLVNDFIQACLACRPETLQGTRSILPATEPTA